MIGVTLFFLKYFLKKILYILHNLILETLNESQIWITEFEENSKLRLI